MMKRNTVLIGDNNIEFRKSLTAELSKEGYKVETAQRMGDILEILLGERISLIVMNLQAFPNYEVISMIRKINKKIPIVTVTDDDSIDTERKVRQEGVFFYFVKPLTLKDMKVVINSAIGRDELEKCT